jgi:hypothetical protein
MDKIIINQPNVLGSLWCIGWLFTIGYLKLSFWRGVLAIIIWPYYLITVLVAATIGVFTGIIFNFDYRLSLLAGYAGTDIIEGIYKSFKVDKTYIVRKK